MTITQKQALHDLLCTVSGYDSAHVIDTYPNTPRPTVPFLSVNYRSHQTEAMAEVGKPIINADGTVTTRQVKVRRTCYCEVQIIGSDADALSLIIDKLFLPTSQGVMMAADFSVYDTDAVQDISGVVNKATYEKRAYADLRVRYTSLLTDDITDIHEVDIGSIVGDLAEDTVTITGG